MFHCQKFIPKFYSGIYPLTSSQSIVVLETLKTDSKASGLLLWLTSLRQRVGTLVPKHYTGVVQKARTTNELLDVVTDFDRHLGPKPNPIFLGAAAKTAISISKCPTIEAARLLNRIPLEEIDPKINSVAFQVLNKAATVGDGTAARLAFSRLLEPNGWDWYSLLRANCGDDGAVRTGILRDMISSLACTPDVHPTLLGSALKEASSLRDMDLLECVWLWSLPLRSHLLQLNHNTPDSHIALKYAQYVLSASRMGHLDHALRAWNEWRLSVLESSGIAAFSDVLRSTAVAAAAFHGNAKTAEEIYRTRPASYGMPTETHDEGRMLVSLMTAFSHAGLPGNAVLHLREIESKAVGLIDIRIYNAAIDACARAGDFAQARAIISGMTVKGLKPDMFTWMTLLGPCRRYRNVSVAEYAFNQITQLPDHDAAAYIVLSDVYCAVDRHDLAEELHQRRLQLGLHKQRGAVDISIGGQVHTFHGG